MADAEVSVVPGWPTISSTGAGCADHGIRTKTTTSAGVFVLTEVRFINKMAGSDTKVTHAAATFLLNLLRVLCCCNN